MRTHGRRHLLAGLGLGAATPLLAPALRGFVRAAQGAPATNRRLFLLSTGNGWGHQATDRNSEILNTTVAPDASFTLPPALMPLVSFHKKLLIARPFDNPHGVNLHGNGWATLSLIPPQKNGPGGISIDRVIAKAIGSKDAYDEVHLGLAVFGKLTNSVTSTSADGPGRPYPAIPTPVRGFQTYFGNVMAKTPQEVQAVLAQDKSLLDAVCGDITRVAGRLAGPEKAKLDQLLESCRTMERQLAKRAEAGAMGLRPEAPPADLDRSGLRAEIVRGHAEVIANALAFGITHVAHLSLLGRDAFNDSWSSFGIPGDAHETYSHLQIAGWTKDQYNAGLAKITSFYAGEVAHVMGRLRELPEGGGTVADGTLAVWHNSGGGKHHNGNSHHAVVMVGDLGGVLKTGRFVTYPFKQRSMADVWVTVARAMGVPMEKFGDPAINKGPLTELLA